MRITTLAVRYPTLTVIATLVIVLWGLSYFNSMSRREDPEFVIRAARVITVFPGATTENVEQYVTKPLEDVIAEIAEASEISSTSQYSISVIFVELDPATRAKDVAQVWDRLRAKIDAIRGSLPAGVSDPLVDDEFFDTSSHVICVSGEDYTPRELYAFADRIKTRLSAMPAAGKVNTWAEQEERIYLEYDQAQISRYGIDFRQMLETIQRTNQLSPGGEIQAGGKRYSIDSTGGFESLEDIENLPVYGTPGGQQVRLGDLGEARYGFIDPPTYLARVNGLPCVLINIVMKDGKNVMVLGRQVEEKLAQIRKSLPDDLEITLVQDQPYQVGLTINKFLSNLYTGIGLVILVVFLFLGFRTSIPVGLAIPLVLIASFAVMSLLGTTLQQMSIAGLIIALGMLVDNAIVVTENISRYLEMGYERTEAAVKATGELAMPMLTSTLTTVCAFLPLLAIGAETGAFIRDIPITVSTAILISFFVAITVTPMLCSRLLVSRKQRKPFQPLDPLMKLLERGYPPLLRWTQCYPGLTLTLVLIAFMLSLFLFSKLGVQFFPSADRNQLTIDMYLPTGSSIYETSEVARYAEQIIARQEGVTSFVVNIGQGGPLYYYNRIPNSMASNYAEFLVNTTDPGRTALLLPKLRRELRENVPGALIEVRALEQGPPIGAPIQIKAQGENIGELKRIAAEIKQILAQSVNVIDINDSFGEDSRQLLLNVDETQLRATGMTKGDINEMTAIASVGMPVTEYRAPGRTIPLVLRPRAEDRNEALDLDALYVTNLYTGTPVALSSIAHFETVAVTSKISRFNRVRQMTVSASTSGGRLASSVLAEALPAIRAIELPPGYEILIRGEAEESGAAFSGLGVGLVIALLLMVLILVAQFKSIRIGLVVFLAIPLSLIGAALGLYLTGWPFGFTAGLGIVSLAGIVINNSIVLMDFIMDKLRQGMDLDEAINTAGQARLRPIILTTLTTIGGLLPLGLWGGSMWAPMAFAIIGGLVVSTFLTLIVVPLIFRYVGAKRALQLVAAEKLEAGVTADQSSASSD